jgi:uncharacterized YigZ family protein
VSDAYRTLAGPCRAEFTVQGSRFIGHARPAATVEEAESFLAEVEAEYADATHNVPAYRVRVGDDTLGSGMLREYSSDDGEPTGSAGKPMRNVLQGQELENVVVVVTRYYGGTNLGVGGLVRAYSKAVKDAVSAGEVVEEVPHGTFRARVDYDDSGTIRGILESTGVEFEADYGEAVSFSVRVPLADLDGLQDRLRSATSGRVVIED